MKLPENRFYWMGIVIFKDTGTLATHWFTTQIRLMKHLLSAKWISTAISCMPVVIVLHLLSMADSTAQPYDHKRANYWYFGRNSGVQFSGDSVQPMTNSAMNQLEGCATISDTAGNLLFYTNGIFVWNKFHLKMPNGNNLHGDWSSANSALIVPAPCTDNIYYIFTTPAFAGVSSGQSEMEYAVVDMNLWEGKGDVVSKNHVLMPTALEMLGGTRHANTRDYWVVGQATNTNTFHSFLVTGNGVSETPVLSPVGELIEVKDYEQAAISTLKFSPSGTRVAVTYYGSQKILLLDFDASSGELSNPLELPVFRAWSSAFSPSENVLYVETSGAVDQYDLSSPDSAAIMASELHVFQYGSNSGSLQLGPDQKIYATQYESEYLSVIRQPDVVGMGCDFVQQGVFLDGKVSLLGITNFVQSYFSREALSDPCAITSDETVAGRSITLFPNPMIDHINVSFPDPVPHVSIRMFNSAGQQVHHSIHASRHQVTISREALPAGIYLLECVLNHLHTYVEKVVVLE